MNPLARPGARGTIARVAVLVVAVALLGFRLWYFARLGNWPWLMLITGAVQLSVVVAGVAACRRRPDSRVGLILLAWAGYVLVIGLGAAESGAVLIVEYALDPWYWILLAHALLTYPDGRTHTRPERILLVIGYAWPLWWFTGAMFVESSWLVSCPAAGCPANPFLITVNTAFAHAWFAANNVIAIGLGVFFIALVVLRRRRIAPPQRRSAAPALWAIGVLTFAYLLQAVLYLIEAPSGGAWEILWWTRRLATLLVPIGLLIALTMTKLARADVATLLLRLRDTDIAGLEAGLAALLRDPTLRISREPGDDGIDLGDGYVLVHHPSARTEDADLFDAGVTAARMTIDNNRLHRQVQEQLAQVSASRQRLVHAAEAERKRVERDLHDGAQQQLIGVGIALETARLSVPDGHPAAMVLDEASGQLRQSIDELRSLARGLRPAMLTERGLATALTELRRRAGIPVTLDVAVATRLAPDVEDTAYFVVSEALQNVAKHAPGASVQVRVALDDGILAVVVSDEGPGGADLSRGSGLRGLADRVAAIGGTLTVDSRHGSGTVIRALIPARPL